MYNAETDHIVPLKQIFNQLQNNMGLSDGDIKELPTQKKILPLQDEESIIPKGKCPIANL